jgi:CheY-like chemotaxis protein
VLAEQIRATHQLADCPIIFLTPAGQVDVDNLAAGFSNAWHLSKPAKGSELIDAVRQALGPMAQSTTEDPTDKAPGRRGRILLVDDAPVNQEVAQGLLEMQGYEVSLADNGRDALEALDREAFDVILMDLEMPEMDGMSATAEIRRRELTTSGRTPIIAMTAHGVSALRTECLKLGMDGYLTKPIQPQELFDALDRRGSVARSRQSRRVN